MTAGIVAGYKVTSLRTTDGQQLYFFLANGGGLPLPFAAPFFANGGGILLSPPLAGGNGALPFAGVFPFGGAGFGFAAMLVRPIVSVLLDVGQGQGQPVLFV